MEGQPESGLGSPAHLITLISWWAIFLPRPPSGLCSFASWLFPPLDNEALLAPRGPQLPLQGPQTVDPQQQ